MKLVVAVVIALFGAAIVLLVVFTLGMRLKSPLVLNAIRRMNREWLNPRQRDAGAPGAYASLIRHRGRSTGASYETPVVAAETEDGFVIALPYGSRSDWLRNLLAEGSAAILHEGRTYELQDPEVVSIEGANAYFSAGDQRAHKIFGTDECVRIKGHLRTFEPEVGQPGL